MNNPSIPTLQTQRLVLRPMAEADFPAYAAFLASPRAAGLGGPLSQRQAWGLFCHDIACWTLFGHGGLMIDRRADGLCIGQVGISHGPLFLRRSWAGCSTKAMRVRATRPRLPSRCATGRGRHSGLPSWSAISRRTTPARPPWRSGSAPSATSWPTDRTRTIWSIGTGSSPRPAKGRGGLRQLLLRASRA